MKVIIVVVVVVMVVVVVVVYKTSNMLDNYFTAELHRRLAKLFQINFYLAGNLCYAETFHWYT